MQSSIEARIADRLRFLYGNADALDALKTIISRRPIAPRGGSLTERDAVLIAYADHVRQPDAAPLETLRRFAVDSLRDAVSAIHILPFYPFTSDDGFSVSDYRAVNPDFGDWDMIRRIGADFRLMFDVVLNHASVSSAWFQAFLRGEPPFDEYFVTASPDDDLSMVVRPRTHPLLTPFETATGTRYVWTTFSTDQADLNFANPAVLLEMIDILLFYIQQGADLIRLDAIAFLWKTPGTVSIHLPQTHAVVKLMRDVLDAAAPWVTLITETNVPHVENLSYFGSGTDEAQMVYQFALPPLLLHTFYTGDALTLSEWAATLETPSDRTTFFNFTASHDGIGIRPASGLISDAAIQSMLDTVLARGGRISYKANPDSTQSAYEMNITYFDALAIPGEPLETSVDRFLASQSIMLALAGVPGIYLPSLFGGANWQAGVEKTGRARTINREKYDLDVLQSQLNDSRGRYGCVFNRYRELLGIRRSQPAFHPNSPQRVLDLHPAVFALERGSLLALHSVSEKPVDVALPSGSWRDLIGGEAYQASASLRPYQVLWLVQEG